MKIHLQRLIWPVFLVTSMAVNMVLMLVLIDHITEAPFDPFGEFPIQQAAPSMVVGESIVVEGQKCYTQPVVVTGTVVWRMLAPVSAQFEAFTGTAVRTSEGCVTATFENQMPDDVASFVRGKLIDGEEVLMRLEGAETPVRGGVTQRWESTVFEVVWR